MDKKEIVTKDPLTVYLKPDLVNYGLSKEEALKELEARISVLKGPDKKKNNLIPVRRVLYGMQLMGMPGHGLLKMAQILPTSAYQSYLSSEISKHSRVYVEVVETGFYIFMVCDRTIGNLDDMISLI